MSGMSLNLSETRPVELSQRTDRRNKQQTRRCPQDITPLPLRQVGTGGIEISGILAGAGPNRGDLKSGHFC